MPLNPFSLPPEITSSKVFLKEGFWAYVFRHKELRELGRCLIVPQGNQSILSWEVAGFPEDPMTETRKSLLQPLIDAATQAFSKLGVPEKSIPLQSYAQGTKHIVESMAITCPTCEAPVALLVFAPTAIHAGELEDQARLMYHNITTMSLPTWILGKEEAITENISKALIMKVWPEREQARERILTEFDGTLDHLQSSHCASTIQEESTPSTRYYSFPMLPGVHYDELESEDDFEDLVLDLEFETMSSLSHFTEGLKEILLSEKLLQIHELMLAHLCGYLGYMITASFNKQEGERLLSFIEDLLKTQAFHAYNLFSRYPVSADRDESEKEKHLQALRDNAPGSLVVQTVRLGRVIGDALQELHFHISPYRRPKKQENFFCPPEKLMKLFKKHFRGTKKRWQEELPLIYAINQTTLQIAWVMGYFSYYDRKEPTQYLEYGVPCISMFSNFARKLNPKKVSL